MTDAVILLDKPPGLSSFKALAEVKARLSTRKVGHAGTLDPFADGLLVALCGGFTRLAGFASAMDKEYMAAISFGRTTDTLDPEGELVGEGPVPDRSEVQSALAGFLGEILQVPPAFSAVHVGGRRAYEAARKGEALTLSPRRVVIHELQLLDFAEGEAMLRICCSRGTYIRSLARDIAGRLGTIAYVRRLRRTRIGGFRVEEAVAPAMFDPGRHLLSAARFFAAAPELGTLVLKEAWTARAACGKPLTDESFDPPPPGDGTYGAFAPGGRLVAMALRRDGGWSYEAVFAGEGQS